MDSDCLFNDDEYISQREIEKDLFEDFDRNLDRSFSIFKFIFVIAGFYAVAFVYIYGKFDINLVLHSAPYPPTSTYSIGLCFLMVFLAFIISFQPLRVARYKFVETKRSIRYREGPELEKNNRRVALNIRKQGYFNTAAAVCILFSFLYFIGYFINSNWFIGIFGMTVCSVSSFVGHWIDIRQIEKDGREEP